MLCMFIYCISKLIWFFKYQAVALAQEAGWADRWVDPLHVCLGNILNPTFLPLAVLLVCECDIVRVVKRLVKYYIKNAVILPFKLHYIRFSSGFGL